ncbi:BamA/TamA family outer membrane protein [Luteolibacter marinus]|uniref:BamA/TamA family outer membrane protein n=1 Tax=Luteolibacter marinus TaxID=2776705 RepID=UPI001865B6DD|nr:BamA/TamA family outer membrane protein [Luteolibacter marinus]
MAPRIHRPAILRPVRRWMSGAAAIVLAGPVATAQSTGPIADDGSATGFLPRHFPALFDDEDGMLDLSERLDQAYGFFPLVSPITEPAVGTGAAFVPLFIDQPEDKGARPNLWALGAMATNNGSRGYFAAASHYFDGDKWHVHGAAADISVNLDFNGLGSIANPSGNPLRYNLEMTGGSIGADRRIGDTKWRAGLRYLYGEVTPSLDFAGDLTSVGSPGFISRFGTFDFSTTISSLQAALIYDSRDNVFTPTRGIFSELNLGANLTFLGGSTSYQTLAWTGIWYRPVVEDCLYFGWRGDVSLSFGSVPLYLRPSVSLRGVPARSAQGVGVASTEAELRWQFHPRWSVLAFAGLGVAWPDKDALFQDTKSVASGGAGLRYLIARRQGIHAGIDVAFSDGESAVYLQFGSSWFRP